MKRSVLSLILLIGATGLAQADSSTDTWRQQMEQKIDALTQELENSKLAPTGQTGAAAGAGSRGGAAAWPWRLIVLARPAAKCTALTMACPSAATAS